MGISVIVISLIFLFILSSLIAAYRYANKVLLALELKKNEDGKISYTLGMITENPRLYVASLKFGSVICWAVVVYYAWHLAMILSQSAVSKSVFFLVYFAVVMVVLYLVEHFLPKIFIKPNATFVLTKMDALIGALLKILVPFTRPLIQFADFCLIRFFGIQPTKNTNLLSIGELGSYISKQIDAVEQKEDLDAELQILQNALSFTDVKVKTVMTPRVDMSSVLLNDDFDHIRQVFVETGYSKLLVYDEKGSNPLGYIHVFDLLKKPENLPQILRPIIEVYENTYINDLFQTLSLQQKSIAVVIDEYGDISGMVTMEDIIEELFGEIDDEHDHDERVEKKIDECKYIFSARLEVEYLNEKYNLQLPESDDYNTLGGFVITHCNQIPLKGDVVTINNYQIKILSATERKIDVIELNINQ